MEEQVNTDLLWAAEDVMIAMATWMDRHQFTGERGEAYKQRKLVEKEDLRQAFIRLQTAIDAVHKTRPPIGPAA